MKRAKVIIVDDEEINADGVAMLARESKLPIDVVGIFYSSKMALNYLENNSVDLVITDIQMPEISGLDLIESMLKEQNEIRVIIFTGYGTLEYAKEAMRLGVRHFLLKPVIPLELKESIVECLSELKRDKENHLLKRKEIIEETILAGHPIAEKINSFSLIMYSESLIDRMNRRLEAFLSEENATFCCGSIGGAMVYYVFSPENILIKLKTYDFQAVKGVMFVSGGQNLFGLNDLFSKGLSSFQYSFYYAKMRVLFANELFISEIPLEKIERNFEKLYSDILSNQFSAVKEEVHTMLERYRIANANVEIIKAQFQKLFVKITDFFGLREEKYKEIGQDILKSLYYLDIEKIFYNLLEDIQQVVGGEDKLGTNISANLNLIIENSYSNEALSLRWISKNVLFLNSEYLGKVFLKDNGEKFSSKLLEVRMLKAAELLKEKKKVGEVAQLVGYKENPDYFGQLFKKKYGLTPKKFREKYYGR